jgi:hypothetical protein
MVIQIQPKAFCAGEPRKPKPQLLSKEFLCMAVLRIALKSASENHQTLQDHSIQKTAGAV